MQKIEWSENYKIGIQEIDDQHKSIFQMVNELIDAQELSVNSKVVSETLYKMIKYAELHFNCEEQYMTERNFPGLALQKQQHLEFRKMLAGLCEDTLERKKEVPGELLGFLLKWIIDHVLNSDQMFKIFLNEQDV